MLIYLQAIEEPEDRSKFEQVYLAYRGLMFHVAKQLLNSDEDAWDAVHDAFVSITKNIKKISEPVCPKTKGFVVIVVERKSLDILRRRKRMPTGELDDELPGVPIDCEGGSALAQCIARLPARYREIILLKYDQGYTTREVAQIMGLTLANTQSLDQRAKKRLEKLCKEEGLL